MDEALQQLQERLQYRFQDPALLRLAVTHASVRADGLPSNERLEFLGDAVVGLVISEHLFRSSPDLSEGEMTLTKSAVVSGEVLFRAGRSLGLAQFLQVDQGLRQRREYPASIIADGYEAIVGAIFLDGGLEAAADFVLRSLNPEIEQVQAGQHALSYKSLLQERTQAEGKGTPRYSVVRYEGPDHQRRYLTVVRVYGEECGAGWGSTIKAAEQNAAQDALDKCYPGWEGTKEPPG